MRTGLHRCGDYCTGLVLPCERKSPKQDRHSVGVTRQYCGQLGKQDNFLVAVSLSIANHAASLPVAYQLYLPREWAQDRARRRKHDVPWVKGVKSSPRAGCGKSACPGSMPPRHISTLHISPIYGGAAFHLESGAKPDLSRTSPESTRMTHLGSGVCIAAATPSNRQSEQFCTDREPSDRVYYL
jgi:hypothetical protein